MNANGLAARMLAVAMVLVPGSTLAFNTFYQCANSQTGALRAVSPGAECRANEYAIVLNVPEVVHGSVINGNAYTNGARGFTYTRQQAGQYVVTFSTPLSAAPDCVAGIINPPVNAVSYCDTTNTTLSASAVAVACWTFDPGTQAFTLTDRDFTFTCTL